MVVLLMKKFTSTIIPINFYFIEMPIVKIKSGIFYNLVFPDLGENLFSDWVWVPLLYLLDMHLNTIDYRLELAT